MLPAVGLGLRHLLVTWSATAFFSSYVVAMLAGYVDPFLRYVSDTGTTPLESDIFGLMINVSAFLGAATMYVRYKIMWKQSQAGLCGTKLLSTVSLGLGLANCVGMGIVTNFQKQAVPMVHDAGVLLTCVCSVVYTLLQLVISYKSCSQWNSPSMCHTRMGHLCHVLCSCGPHDHLCVPDFYHQLGMEP